MKHIDFLLAQSHFSDSLHHRGQILYDLIIPNADHASTGSAQRFPPHFRVVWTSAPEPANEFRSNTKDIKGKTFVLNAH